MSVKIVDKFLKDFVSADEIRNMQPSATVAYNLLKEGNGPGNDYIGWVDLPVNYDKEEFERIIKAAERMSWNMGQKRK